MKHTHKQNALKIVKFAYRFSRWLLLALFRMMCFIVYFLAGGDKKPLPCKNAPIQADKGPDDIWNQTTGDRYYSNEPPQPFE